MQHDFLMYSVHFLRHLPQLLLSLPSIKKCLLMLWTFIKRRYTKTKKRKVMQTLTATLQQSLSNCNCNCSVATKPKRYRYTMISRNNSINITRSQLTHVPRYTLLMFIITKNHSKHTNAHTDQQAFICTQKRQQHPAVIIEWKNRNLSVEYCYTHACAHFHTLSGCPNAGATNLLCKKKHIGRVGLTHVTSRCSSSWRLADSRLTGDMPPACAHSYLIQRRVIGCLALDLQIFALLMHCKFINCKIW